MKEWFLSLADGFSQTFIEDGRWVLFAKGLALRSVWQCLHF